MFSQNNKCHDTIMEPSQTQSNRNTSYQTHGEPTVVEWHSNKQNYFHSIRWKVLSIALIGSLSFLIFLVYTLIVSNMNSIHLFDVSNKAMPVMHDLQNSMFELRLTQNALQDAVITGDSDAIVEAKQHSIQFHKLIRTFALVDREKTRKLLAEFDAYYLFSEKLAIEISHGSYHIEDIAAKGEKSSKQFEHLLNNLSHHSAENTEYFRNQLESAAIRSENSFVVGLILGIVMIAVVFTVALFTIRTILDRIEKFSSSLKKLAIDSSDMSARIDVHGSDEMAELAHWFNTFVVRLNHLTEQTNKEIRELAFSDALTNLPNRREFLRCLKRELEIVKRFPGNKIAVLFLDLDNFKSVNDQKGHDAGDELLCNVAKMLKSVLRGYDTLSIVDPSTSSPHFVQSEDTDNGRDIVARLGGDEFLLLLTNLNNDEDIEIVAKRILKSIDKSHVIQGEQFRIGVSIGIAVYPHHGTTVDELVNHADSAMYQAKHDGKNMYKYYSVDDSN